MAIELLIAAVLTLGLAYVVAQRPELADRILFTRKVLFGLLGIIIAIILIGTGSPTLMFIGAVALFIGWLWLLRTKPYEEF